MATANFSVPDEIKAAFDREFEGQNKSAIIADCMRKAVDEARRRKRRERIFHVLTERRRLRPAVSDRKVAAARAAGRK